ncbi:MAG: hypothetical protein FWC43_11305 [Planctomycetaceae bacterium]|nr:hypothetical protein [Planctomycetaceae bacterium]
MKPEKVLKFKGIGHRESGIGNRESGIGNWKLEEVFHLSPMPDARFPMPLTVLSHHLFTV